MNLYRIPAAPKAPSFIVPVRGQSPKQFGHAVDALDFAGNLAADLRSANHDVVVGALVDLVRFNNNPVRGAGKRSVLDNDEGFGTMTVSL